MSWRGLFLMTAIFIGGLSLRVRLQRSRHAIVYKRVR
jgi:hypothetical protein